MSVKVGGSSSSSHLSGSHSSSSSSSKTTITSGSTTTTTTTTTSSSRYSNHNGVKDVKKVVTSVKAGTVKGSFTRTALGGWESTQQKALLEKAAATASSSYTLISSGKIDENKVYMEKGMNYLIQKEIQTRDGETRTLKVNATISDREQALWMFNTNLNWRLDFLGRFILSQKKKVRINHQIATMTKQYSFVSAVLTKVTKQWAEAKFEAETVSAQQ